MSIPSLASNPGPLLIPSRLPTLVVLAMLLAALPQAPAQSANDPSDDSHRLRELDLIIVQVYGEADLSKQTRIDGSGQIRMGLIGAIGIAGLTVAEAEDLLEKTYLKERYLRDPQISIEVLEYAPLFVHVFGQVRQPGRVRLEGEQESIPLLDLISAAGGFTGLARSDNVRITRTDESGDETIVNVDVESLINGKAKGLPGAFEELLPGDVVYVPERLF